jgi:hypothetical protein
VCLCLRDENRAIEVEVSRKQYDAVGNIEIRILAGYCVSVVV